MSDPPGRHRSTLLTALRYLLPPALMGLAIATNWSQIRAVAGHRPDGSLFALGFAAYLAGVLLAFVRWFLLARALDLPFRPGDALRLGFIGTLFNFVIPGAIGGDFVRAAFLAREQKRKSAAVATVVIDRLVGLLGLFLLGCITGVVAWTGLDPKVRRLVRAAGIASGVVALILLVAFTPALYRPLIRLAERRGRKAKLLRELVATGTAYRDHLGIVVVGVIGGLITHSLNVTAFYAVSRALQPGVPGLAEHFMIVPLVLFSTAIPLPFGALGVSEQVSFGLFRLAKYSGGAVAMMAFRLLQFGGAMIGGCVYFANQGQVRALREEAEALAADPFDEPAAVTTPAGAPPSEESPASASPGR
jgi:uncharacterized protein (TIRG00374 family)